MYTQTPNCGSKTVQVFTEKKKNLHISGPAQFKPVLFNG